VSDRWRITPQGLELISGPADELTDAEWLEVGQRLARMLDGFNWVIGDWLRFGGRGGHGASYDQAAAITGRSPDSLSQMYRVACAYPTKADRVVGANWTMHREALRVEADLRRRVLLEAVESGIKNTGLALRISAGRPLGPAAPHRGGADAVPRVPAAAKSSIWRRGQQAKYPIRCPQCGARFQRRFPATSLGSALEHIGRLVADGDAGEASVQIEALRARLVQESVSEVYS
jgi:hypothetical protein